MTGGDAAFLALAALFALDAAWSRYRFEKLVKHLAEMLASRSISEWAAAQNTLAKAEYRRKGEKPTQPEGFNGLF